MEKKVYAHKNEVNIILDGQVDGQMDIMIVK